MTRLALVAMIALSLAGCAEGARSTEMTVIPANQVAQASPLRDAVSVGAVSGGEATNPLWTSQVGNPDFQKALTASLTAEGMLADGSNGHYRLDVTLEKIDQPLMGFDMTVTSKVHYVLTDTTTGKPAFDQEVTESYTASVSDAFMGVERLRMANEGSIKKNIGSFLDQAIAKLGTAPSVSQIDIKSASPQS